MAEAASAGCDVAEYSPNEIKQAVAILVIGKDEVGSMVQTLLGLPSRLSPADAADAVVIDLPSGPAAGTTRFVRAVGANQFGQFVTESECVMIGSLRGRLIDRGHDGELRRGQRGRVPSPCRPHRSPLEISTVRFFVHTHHAVREDSETLYGFATIAERRIFESPISAHGVGPALALVILSVHGPDVAPGGCRGRCRCPVPGPRSRQEDCRSAGDELKSKLDLPEGEAHRVS